jgi:hypothetical protein
MTVASRALGIAGVSPEFEIVTVNVRSRQQQVKETLEFLSLCRFVAGSVASASRILIPPFGGSNPPAPANVSFLRAAT